MMDPQLEVMLYLLVTVCLAASIGAWAWIRHERPNDQTKLR